jgi:hypothetical protein
MTRTRDALAVRRLFAGFVALQTFFFLARADRWGILFSFAPGMRSLVLLLWVKDITLAVAAGFAASRVLEFVVSAAARDEIERPPELSPIAEAAWVVPVLSLGIALRAAFRSINPPGVWVDVVQAAQPLFGRAAPPPWGVSPFGEDRARFEVISNLYLTFVRGVLALFGSGEAGLFALSALPGALLVPAAWWLAREAYGARAGVFAALFASFLGWPLLLARWSTTAALLLVLVCLAGAAALRALRTGSFALAALAGVCVGLSLHTHASAGAVAAGFGAFALTRLRGPAARRLVLAAAGGAALAAAPLAWGFIAGAGRLGGHLRDVHLGVPTKEVDVPWADGILRLPVALVSNAVDYTGVLLWTADPSERNAPRGALMTIPVGILALLAFGFAGERKRTADALFLWLSAATLLAGILSTPDGAPNTLRVCVLVVPLIVLSAALLDGGMERASQLVRARRPALLALAAATLLVFEALPSLVDAPDLPGVAPRFCAAETEAGRILRRLGDGPVVLEKGAVLHALVAEAVAHGEDRTRPFDSWPRRTRAELNAAPPPGGTWLYASRRAVAELGAVGVPVSRGVVPSPVRPDLVLARVGTVR